jgi:hypothetical protein
MKKEQNLDAARLLNLTSANVTEEGYGRKVKCLSTLQLRCATVTIPNSLVKR